MSGEKNENMDEDSVQLCFKVQGRHQQPLQMFMSYSQRFTFLRDVYNPLEEIEEITNYVDLGLEISHILGHQNATVHPENPQAIARTSLKAVLSWQLNSHIMLSGFIGGTKLNDSGLALVTKFWGNPNITLTLSAFANGKKGISISAQNHGALLYQTSKHRKPKKIVQEILPGKLRAIKRAEIIDDGTTYR